MIPSTQRTSKVLSMKVLSRDSLKLGGFAGITEHRLVTDSRVFGARKKPETFEGFGNMVYLADARYNPLGSSGMHPHSEIDVISIIIEGRVSHEGSMEHGKDLIAGDVQVQRAGGEGFNHNEINPDNKQNRMLQVWALPEQNGQPADYKAYTPSKSGVTRIYGGDNNQHTTFNSHTVMEIVHLQASESMQIAQENFTYIISGAAVADNLTIGTDAETTSLNEGDLISSQGIHFLAKTDLHMLVVKKLTD